MDDPRLEGARPVALPSLEVAPVDTMQLRAWIDVVRLAVATAIFAAALWAWDGAVPADTKIAALAFAGAAGWTTVSFMARSWRDQALFGALVAQVIVDLSLATASVHVTGGAASQFAALYVLAITEAALLLPIGGAFVAAAGACAFYSAEVVSWRPAGGGGVALVLQLAVFAAVALGAGLVGARLQQVGAGGERLVAALARARHEARAAARVEASDVLRNMPSGIVTVDASGRLLFANPAAATLLGVALGSQAVNAASADTDAFDAGALQQLAAVAPALADIVVRAARDGERTTRAEVAVMRPDGREATIGVTTTASDGMDGARAATAIFSDITDTKRVAALHLRAERLEAVAELAASLAHEIRNPLASIRSAVEQLARLATQPAGVDAAERAEVREDVQTLAGLTVRESDRLSRLLGEFLDFSRARVTRLDAVDLAEAARAAVRLAAAHPDAARVELVVRVAGASVGVVDADAELLHRALFNLVLNAAQAARSRVDVAVWVPGEAELPAGLAFAHGALAVRVRDDGPGVSPDVADRLFEPFVTTKVGGSGLGLAIVQRAVEAHGGVVLVGGGTVGGESVGGGAAFTLVLPRALPRATAVARAVEDGAARGAPVRPYLPTPAAPVRAVC